MNKLTQISGLNNKLGQNSRTGSNISIFVPDELIQEVTQYYVEVKANKETLGKVKKIELVIYEDGDELETIEALRAENKELKEFIESIDQPIKEAVEAISEVTEDIKEDLSTNDQANTCGKCNIKPEVGNCNQQCAVITGNMNDRNLFEEKEMQGMRHEGVETSGTVKKENLPANQVDLKLYDNDGKQELPRVGDKKVIIGDYCKCETSAIVNGKCANCGGVE